MAEVAALAEGTGGEIVAEFSEVMKQLARMANACKGKCDKCPLDNSTLCTGPWCFGNMESITEAERIVMQWAAEHPEPVYPTWFDFLVEQGLAEQDRYGQSIFHFKEAEKQIPADIVQKLGIEPKEG